MAYENDVRPLSFKAAADLSSSQYLAVRLDTSAGVLLSNATSETMGILQNNPVTNALAAVSRPGDVTKAVVSGTLVIGVTRLASDANGLLVPTTSDNDEVIAIALSARSGASSSIGTVLQVGPARY